MEGNCILPFTQRPAQEKTPTVKDGKKTKWSLTMKSLLRFKMLKIWQLLLTIYIAVLVYAPQGTFGQCGGLIDPETGFITDPNSPHRTELGIIMVKGDLRPIVATNTFQLVCIGISRMSAFFMYPALVFVFFAKLRATTGFLASTPLSMFMFEDLHDLHIYCGTIIFFDSLIHTLFHLLRWIDQGNFLFLVNQTAGLSGVFIILACLLICIPMMYCKNLKFEIRKYCHYLYYVFAVALCFHAPASAVPNGGFAPYVFGTLIIWTFLDSTYVYLFMTEKIETTVFHVLPTGIQLTMDVSDRFQRSGQQGGYCYVCFPWIDKNQWHAFSLFENPWNPRQRQIFISRCGDWTNAVHESLKRSTNRPIWVQGPFPSPYSNSIDYDNQVLVASGIGITPALSVIRRARQEGARRANLVWIVRDPHMLEFFLEHAYLESNNGWNLIYYTGKQPFVHDTVESITSSNVCVIHGRPDLKNVVPSIIQGIETGRGLPERYIPSKKQEAVIRLADELARLEMGGMTSEQEKLAHLSRCSRELGFLFTDLVSVLDHVTIDELHHNRNPVDDASSALTLDITTDGRNTPSDASVCRVYRPDSILEQLPSTACRMSMSRDVMTPHDSAEEGVRRRAPKKKAAPSFMPWKGHRGALDFVKHMTDMERATWGILYCGGSKVLETKVEQIAEEIDIDFHTESFAW